MTGLLALLLRVFAFVVLVLLAVAPQVFGAAGLADLWRWFFAAVSALVLALIVPEVHTR